MSTVTIEALLRAGVHLLEGTSPSPRLDTELLLAHALGWTRVELFTRRAEALAAGDSERCLALLRERQTGRPVAQLTGRRGFWTLELEVTADVLTPRPETELLVERALARLPPAAGARLLDLGTGSGAVALAIAAERPDAAIVATERSAAALAVAARNARQMATADIRLVEGDWLDAVPGESFAVIVSNPPYLATAEWPLVPRDLHFEPRMALVAGEDGLAELQRIAGQAPGHLVPGGWLLLEHGASQGPEVQALLRQAGLVDVATSHDLAGHPRVTEGRRRG